SSASDSEDETIDPAYTVTAPQTPFPVAEGGMVQVTVTVPPLGGAFNNPVTLSASGLPPRATATFNPPAVTPGDSGQQTMMTIQLVAPGVGNAAVPAGRHAPPMSGWPKGLLITLVMFTMMLAGFLKMPRRKSPRWAHAAAVLLFAATI